MKLTGFTKAITLVAACALAVTALPSGKPFCDWSDGLSLINTTGIESVPGVSPRGNAELDSLVLPPRGITCDGNFNCEGGYCPPDIHTMKTIVDQIRKCRAPHCSAPANVATANLARL